MIHQPVNLFAADARPFQTSDALLAACLYFAGVPFLEPAHPCVHRYDAEKLAHLGFKGLPLLSAAQKAWDQRKRGHILYVFKRPREMPALLKAFHDEEEQISGGTGTGAERLAAIMQLDAIPEVRLVRAACLILKMRLGFMRLWENEIPRLRIMDQGEPEQLGNGRVRYPGWKEIPITATEELKRKMKL